MSITAKEMNSGQKLIMTVITFAPNWWRKNSLSKTKIESADNNEHRGRRSLRGTGGQLTPAPHIFVLVLEGKPILSNDPTIIALRPTIFLDLPSSLTSICSKWQCADELKFDGVEVRPIQLVSILIRIYSVISIFISLFCAVHCQGWFNFFLKSWCLFWHNEWI